MTPTSRTLTLPARHEGPYSWLGKLVRVDARRRLKRGRNKDVNLAELAQTEWEWLRSGWCWLQPDRSALTFDDPNDYLEGIVQAHAGRHLRISDELDWALPPDHPARVLKEQRSREDRLAAIEAAVWVHLERGFCRIADKSDEIVWWHLEKEEFVPFDAEYNLAYINWQLAFRAIVTSIQDPGNRPYLGPTGPTPSPPDSKTEPASDDSAEPGPSGSEEAKTKSEPPGGDRPPEGDGV